MAWDLDREHWRTFRADRIRPRTPTGPRLAPRELPGGTVSGFISSRFRGNDSTTTDWPCQGEAVLHLPATDAAPFAQDGIIEELGPTAADSPSAPGHGPDSPPLCRAAPG